MQVGILPRVQLAQGACSLKTPDGKTAFYEQRNGYQSELPSLRVTGMRETHIESKSGKCKFDLAPALPRGLSSAFKSNTDLIKVERF